MNLHARDTLILCGLTFAEWNTTSLFRLVQTNRIAKKSNREEITINFLFIYYVTSYAVRVLAHCLVKRKTANKMNIL